MTTITQENEYKYISVVESPIIVNALKEVNAEFKKQNVTPRLVVQFKEDEEKVLVFGKKKVTTYRIVLKSQAGSDIKLETISFESVMAYLQGVLFGMTTFVSVQEPEAEAERLGEWKIALQAPDRGLQMKLEMANEVLNNLTSKSMAINSEILIRSRTNMRKKNGNDHFYTEYMLMGRDMMDTVNIKQLSGELSLSELGNHLDNIIANPTPYAVSLK